MKGIVVVVLTLTILALTRTPETTAAGIGLHRAAQQDLSNINPMSLLSTLIGHQDARRSNPEEKSANSQTSDSPSFPPMIIKIESCNRCNRCGGYCSSGGGCC